MTETPRQELAYNNGFRSIAAPAPQRPPTPPWVPARPEPLLLFPPPPASAAPIPEAAPSAPSGPRRRTAVVLAVLAAVLLVGAGVSAGLYVAATGDRAAAEERLAQRGAELAEVRDRVAGGDDERERAEQANTALENENADLNACVEAVRHYLWDEPVGAALTTALDTLFAECR
jgi:hypothetical protein